MCAHPTRRRNREQCSHAITSVFVCCWTCVLIRSKDNEKEKKETKQPSWIWRVDAKECCQRMGCLMPLRNVSKRGRVCVSLPSESVNYKFTGSSPLNKCRLKIKTLRMNEQLEIRSFIRKWKTKNSLSEWGFETCRRFIQTSSDSF